MDNHAHWVMADYPFFIIVICSCLCVDIVLYVPADGTCAKYSG